MSSEDHLPTVALLSCKQHVFLRRAKADEKTERHLNPIKVLHCVDELMDEDSIIVADGGDFVGTAAYIMRPRGPLRWLDPGQILLTNEVLKSLVCLAVCGELLPFDSM